MKRRDEKLVKDTKRKEWIFDGYENLNSSCIECRCQNKFTIYLIFGNIIYFHKFLKEDIKA